jgi:hypothetical protein
MFMFTGSAVRVQAVQDLKLQEEQEIGRRSWRSGRQHPQSPAETGRREGREQEENPRKPPNPENLASLHSLSLSLSLRCSLLFYLSLLLFRCLKLFIYYNYNFISLFLLAGGVESNKLYLLNYKISSHLLQYSYIV